MAEGLALLGSGAFPLPECYVCAEKSLWILWHSSMCALESVEVCKNWGWAVPSFSEARRKMQGFQLVPVVSISAVCTVWWHFCSWSLVEISGREEWKRSGGGAGSLLERCLPSSGVLSPYKEIVVDSVAHRCACNPRLKLVGRDE